jgi:hypothetical protein
VKKFVNRNIKNPLSIVNSEISNNLGNIGGCGNSITNIKRKENGKHILDFYAKQVSENPSKRNQ